ncbi:cysteine-rich receptor-like protein kinase, partial [Trifolium pratense]
MEKMVESEFPQVTPASGINLISGSQCSQVPNPGIDVDGRNKESAIEAAKLLSIQKEVGFSFEEDDDKTLKELMMQERSDRSKKMEWEQKEETKLEVITDSICYSIWGSQDCDWVYLPSVGRSGGILSIWISKRRLWNNLLNCKRGLGDGRWCVVGDFNAIRRMEERIGVNTMVGGTMPTEVIEFQHFIDELELVDLPLFGRRFTWYHANGRAMSRIDRFLISDEWALRWGNGSVWVLDRDVSDHCPLLLKYSHDD